MDSLKEKHSNKIQADFFIYYSEGLSILPNNSNFLQIRKTTTYLIAVIISTGNYPKGNTTPISMKIWTIAFFCAQMTNLQIVFGAHVSFPKYKQKAFSNCCHILKHFKQFPSSFGHISNGNIHNRYFSYHPKKFIQKIK